ncbi:MAG: hypothetical protein R3B60_04140 [Candidatus Paceibacterota bacterium]
MKTKSVFFSAIFFSIILGLSHTTYAEITKSVVDSDILNYHNQAEVEKKVREYFAETPDMIEIARCESNFRQYTDSGKALRGGMNNQMVGVFQFNESLHSADAKKLGFDINTLEGNLAYAKYVYDSQGNTPWISVRHCWENPVLPKVTTVFNNTEQSISKPTKAELKAKIKQLLQLLQLLQQLQKLQEMV